MDMVTYLLLKGKIEQSGRSLNKNLSPEYDPLATYNPGDYALFGDQLRRYDGTTWTDAVISEALTELQNDIENKANIDGYYGGTGLGAATAENLIDTKNPGTPADFRFRTTGSDISIGDNGTARIEEIKGNSVVWNQMLQESKVIPESGTAYKRTVPVSARKAIINKIGGQTVVWNQLVNTDTASVTTTSDRKYLKIIDGTKTIVAGDSAISVTAGSDYVFDLTLMYGSGSEPIVTTDEKVKAIETYVSAHPEYNAGELVSADVMAVESRMQTVMWNQLYAPTASSVEKDGISFTKNNDGSWSVTGTSRAETYVDHEILYKQDAVVGHKYLFLSNLGSVETFGLVESGGDHFISTTGFYNTAGRSYYRIKVRVYTHDPVDFTIYPKITDLTQVFGSGSEPASLSDPRIAAIIAYAEAHPEYNAEETLGITTINSVVTIVPLAEPETVSIPAALREDFPLMSAGDFRDEYDFKRKVHIKRVKDVGDVAELTWIIINPNGPVFGTENSDIYDTQDGTKAVICKSAVSRETGPQGWVVGENNVIRIRSGTKQILMVDKFCATIEELKSKYAGVHIYCALATPIETDISAYLEGFNADLTAYPDGTLTYLQTATELPVPSEIGWEKTAWTQELDSTHHYIYADSTGASILGGQSSVSIAESKKCLIDLTRLLGSGNEPSTVAEFSKMFPVQSYDYDPGRVLGFNGTAIKSVGFNLYNYVTGQAKLVGGKQYQITGSYTSLVYSAGETLTPDTDGYFMPTMDGILTVIGGDDTTCVHLTWSGYRDDEYETYWSLTRKLYVAEYFPDGMHGIGSVHDSLYADKAVQRIATRDYADGDESDSTVLTDGVRTIYPLVTPIITPIDPSLTFTYRVSDFGTEELLPENDAVPTTTPFSASIAYGIDFAREVIRIRETFTPKVEGAVNGNLAGLNGNGETMDSGVKASAVITDALLDEAISLMQPGVYEGVDLTVKFASEIAAAPYNGDPWAWMKGRIRAHNYRGLRYHDYITVTCGNGNVIHPEIVGINTYKGIRPAGGFSGDIPDHIDFMCKEAWTATAGTEIAKWNLVSYNNGLGCDKFTGDGSTTVFQLCHRDKDTFPTISKVMVGGVDADTNTYSYDSETGVLTFTIAPANNTVIKAVWTNPIKWPFITTNAYAYLMSEKMGVPNEAAADPFLIEVDYTNDGVWNFLPDALKNVITAKGVMQSRYALGVLKNADDWTNTIQGYAKLWFISETEISGRNTMSGERWGVQYPAYIGTSPFIEKYSQYGPKLTYVPTRSVYNGPGGGHSVLTEGQGYWHIRSSNQFCWFGFRIDDE